MNFIEERICREALVKSSEALIMDSFLSHQMDMEFLDRIGREIAGRFAGVPVTKVMTIEISGIAVGCAVARELGVPLVVAKKTRSMKLDGDVYSAEVLSFNHKNINTILVAKKFLNDQDQVLIVDDIMANGCALQGLISLVEDAEAAVSGCAVVVEKTFQEGGHRIRNLGYRLEALASIENLDPETGTITFA